VAGRCISADGEAFAAIRVQAPCMESGQAAGFAAAMCVKQGIAVQDVDTKALVEQVRAAGSFV
jgi:carbamoylphosphate synthase small subunit